MVMLLPEMAGEIAPIIIAFLLGIFFGTQLSGTISRRTTLLIIGLGIIAAFLFEAPIFTWSLFGGYITEGFSFAAPFISATIGLFIGKIIRGGKN
ncbi:MAG: hypothetical protein LUP94_02955 [Candidatus Methanomethylicus sp.]|nr:hypothetical protein [Candidatus Methanomethylicus sp.]